MSSDTPAEREPRRLADRLDLLIATLLGLAAILTAVASYQATVKDGQMTDSYNIGIRATNDANAFFGEAFQTVARDQALFLDYAAAAQQENADLAEYLENAIMDDNMRAAVKEWREDEADELATPFDAPAYELPAQAEAERLTEVTEQRFAQARQRNEKGDRYTLVGVIVATSLFFLGIAGVMPALRTKLVATGAGAITLVVAFGLWLTV
jgi:hypothetical protein